MLIGSTDNSITHLQRCVVHPLAHLHYLDDGFLCAQDAQLHNGLIVLLLRAFRAQLQSPNEIELVGDKSGY